MPGEGLGSVKFFFFGFDRCRIRFLEAKLKGGLRLEARKGGVSVDYLGLRVWGSGVLGFRIWGFVLGQLPFQLVWGWGRPPDLSIQSATILYPASAIHTYSQQLIHLSGTLGALIFENLINSHFFVFGSAPAGYEGFP